MKLLVDANNVGYAALFALGDLSFNGMETGVVFGFLSRVLRLTKVFDTDEFIFCWDSRQRYRNLIYPDYKENRKKKLIGKKADDFRAAFEQFNLLRKVILPRMGFRNVFHQAGYEADDLIAWTVARFPDKNVIISNDSDFWQLLYEHRKCYVRTYDIRKKKLFTCGDFVKGWYGLTPDRWAEMKAIMGDTSDGIKGVPGIGPVNAVKYIKGALDGEKRRLVDLKRNKKIVRRNLHLIALPFSGLKPIEIEVKREVFYSMDFMDVFNEFGFSSFLSGFDRWRSAFHLQSGRLEGRSR